MLDTARYFTSTIRKDQFSWLQTISTQGIVVALQMWLDHTHYWWRDFKNCKVLYNQLLISKLVLTACGYRFFIILKLVEKWTSHPMTIFHVGMPISHTDGFSNRTNHFFGSLLIKIFTFSSHLIPSSLRNLSCCVSEPLTTLCESPFICKKVKNDPFNIPLKS